jgi:hypothetical protein
MEKFGIELLDVDNYAPWSLLAWGLHQLRDSSAGHQTLRVHTVSLAWNHR